MSDVHEILSRKPKRRVEWVQKRLKDDERAPGEFRDLIYEVLTRRDGRAFVSEMANADAQRAYSFVLKDIDSFTNKQQAKLQSPNFVLRQIYTQEQSSADGRLSPPTRSRSPEASKGTPPGPGLPPKPGTRLNFPFLNSGQPGAKPVVADLVKAHKDGGLQSELERLRGAVATAKTDAEHAKAKADSDPPKSPRRSRRRDRGGSESPDARTPKDMKSFALVSPPRGGEPERVPSSTATFGRRPPKQFKVKPGLAGASKATESQSSTKEAKPAANSTATKDKEPFAVGQKVYRKGEMVTVMKVDKLVDPPSYVVRKADGSEVGTEHHLLQVDPPSKTQQATDSASKADTTKQAATEDENAPIPPIEDPLGLDDTLKKDSNSADSTPSEERKLGKAVIPEPQREKGEDEPKPPEEPPAGAAVPTPPELQASPGASPGSPGSPPPAELKSPSDLKAFLNSPSPPRAAEGASEAPADTKVTDDSKDAAGSPKAEAPHDAAAETRTSPAAAVPEKASSPKRQPSPAAPEKDPSPEKRHALEPAKESRRSASKSRSPENIRKHRTKEKRRKHRRSDKHADADASDHRRRRRGETSTADRHAEHRKRRRASDEEASAPSDHRKRRKAHVSSTKLRRKRKKSVSRSPSTSSLVAPSAKVEKIPKVKSSRTAEKLSMKLQVATSQDVVVKRKRIHKQPRRQKQLPPQSALIVPDSPRRASMPPPPQTIPVRPPARPPQSVPPARPPPPSMSPFDVGDTAAPSTSPATGSWSSWRAGQSRAKGPASTQIPSQWEGRTDSKEVPKSPALKLRTAAERATSRQKLPHSLRTPKRILGRLRPRPSTPASAVEVSDSEGSSGSASGPAGPAPQAISPLKKPVPSPSVISDAMKDVLRSQLEEKQQQVAALRAKLLRRQAETVGIGTTASAPSLPSAAHPPPPVKQTATPRADVVVLDSQVTSIEKSSSSAPPASRSADSSSQALQKDSSLRMTAALASQIHNERLHEQKRRLAELIQKKQAVTDYEAEDDDVIDLS